MIKITKTGLRNFIKNFLFEDNQKIDKKFIVNITKESGIRHKKTGIEYTVSENNKDEEYIKCYRQDIDNPKQKVYDIISYDTISKEYNMV